MTDEQRPDEAAPPESGAEAGDAPATEQPERAAPEEVQPEAAAGEEAQPDPEVEQVEADEPDAAQPEATPEAGKVEDAEPREAEPAAAAPEAPKAKDQPPGAELDPIAIEPERELSAEEKARLEAEEEERVRLEAEREAGDEPVARTGPRVEIPSDARIQATGKRKSSIARVIVRPGEGSFEVNDRPLDEYFPRQNLRTVARQPLLTAGYEGSVNIKVRVSGGGVSGQAGAVRHGVARALCEIDPELRPELKRRGLLTRDARKKERRKAGLKKARKKPQFSKR
jgi:small subunit ribosomal protein S9